MNEIRLGHGGEAIASLPPSRVCLHALLAGSARERTCAALIALLECEPVLHVHLGRLLGIGCFDTGALRAALLRCSPRVLRGILLDYGLHEAAAAPAAEAWHAAFLAGVRAEQFAGALAMSEARDLRVAVAAAARQSASDFGGAGALGRYRQYPLADIVDAPQWLRVALTALAEPDARAHYAHELLGLAPATTAALEAEVASRATAVLREAGLPESWGDADERAADAGFGRLRDVLARARLWRATLAPHASQIADSVAAIERVLDARCALLRASCGSERFVLVDQPQIGFSAAHARSRVAAAIGARQATRLARWETTAIVDHALFDRLGADESTLAVADLANGDRVAVLLAPVPGVPRDDALLFTQALAQECADQCAAASAPAAIADAAVASWRAHHEREVRTLAHEVSNPLAIIGNYLHLLRDATGFAVRAGERPARGDGGARDGHAQEYLHAMQEEVARAAAMLRDATQRAVAGPDAVPAVTEDGRAQQSIGELCRGLQLAVMPLARARGAQFDAVVEAEGDAQIDDPDVVRQVLVNLVRNALEAVPAATGQVRLHVGPMQYRDARPHWVLEVADNGPGLAADALAALDAPKASTKGGAGLGLAIAHRLVRERLAGALDYEPTRSGGLFRVWVPAQRAGPERRGTRV